MGPRRLVGGLPLADTHVLAVPISWFDDAVPHAEVRRGTGSAVLALLNRRAGPGAWHDDWTLYHELGHLAHPYLGAEGRWIAEGLASYLQDRLRADSGAIPRERAWRAMLRGFASGRTEDSRGTVDGAVNQRTYWAAAVMALELDAMLRQRAGGGTTLAAVLFEFARCELPSSKPWSVERYMHALDTIADTDLFVPTWRRYAAMRRFPDYEPIVSRARSILGPVP